LEEFVAKLELNNYLEKFRSEKLQVSDFAKLTNEELKELVPEMGPRSRLKDYLRSLKAEVPPVAVASEKEATQKKEEDQALHHASNDWHKLQEGDTKAGPLLVEIQMPEFVQDAKEAKLVKWLKNVGDEVKQSEPICEVETDVAVVEMRAQHHGYLGKKIIEGGVFVKTGKVIGVLVQEKEDVKLIANKHLEYA